MYRPKGWKNPYSTLPEHMEVNYPVLPEWTAYEVGADAMLEGLVKAEGKQVITLTFDDKAGTVLYFDIQATQKGTLVFIPEEECYEYQGYH